VLLKLLIIGGIIREHGSGGMFGNFIIYLLALSKC